MRLLEGKERNFAGEHFWARGYAVSTVGFNEEQVRHYIRDQEGAMGQWTLLTRIVAADRCAVNELTTEGDRL